MTITLTQDRLKRMIDAGFRGTCRPAERTAELKRRLKGVDTITIGRMEQVFFGLADRTRLMILELLAKEELCECEITAALDVIAAKYVPSSRHSRKGWLDCSQA